MIIHHPILGRRDAQEFVYLGDASLIDRPDGMTAGIRAKLLAAADYLAVAPTVVEVVRTLDLPDADARLRTPDAAVTAALATEWNLGSSLDRAVTAISARS